MRAAASRRAIGAVVSGPRPRTLPIDTATIHQPTANTITAESSSFAALSTATAPSTVAEAAQTRTVVFRKSTNRTYGSSASSSPRTPRGPSTRTSEPASSSGGVSSERTPTQTACWSRPPSTHSRRARNASRSVRSSPT